METSTRCELQKISKNVQVVGRKIGSTVIDLDDLVVLSEALGLAKEAVDSYIRIESNKYAV